MRQRVFWLVSLLVGWFQCQFEGVRDKQPLRAKEGLREHGALMVTVRGYLDSNHLIRLGGPKPRRVNECFSFFSFSSLETLSYWLNKRELEGRTLWPI